VPIVRVEDPDDPRLAAYRNVPDHKLLTQQGLFVAEGRLVVRRLIETERLPTRSVMVTEAALVPILDLLDTRQELPVYLVPQAVMNGITGFNLHRGALALGERPGPSRWRELVTGARPFVRSCQRAFQCPKLGTLATTRRPTRSASINTFTVSRDSCSVWLRIT